MRILAVFAPLCFLLLAFGGCGAPYDPPQQLPTAYTDCIVPADCEAVEVGCCDECNGGTAYAVASDQVDAVLESYAEDCRAGVDCTEMACGSWVVSCIAGTCSMARGQL